jgi:hypothetical protein
MSAAGWNPELGTGNLVDGFHNENKVPVLMPITA